MKKYLFILPLLLLGLCLLPKHSFAFGGVVLDVSSYPVVNVSNAEAGNLYYTIYAFDASGNSVANVGSNSNVYQNGQTSWSFTYPDYLASGQTCSGSCSNNIAPTVSAGYTIFLAETTNGGSNIDSVCGAGTTLSGCEAAFAGYTQYVGTAVIPGSLNPAGISIFSPADGTSTGVFGNWVVSTTIPDNILYQIQITYGATSSSLNTLVVPTDGIFMQNNNVIQYVPSSITQAGTYFAQASLVTLSPVNSIVATSTVITFDVSSTMPFVSNNTAHFVPPEPTSTAFCIAPSNPLSVGDGISFGLCSIAGTFFGNQVPSYGFLGQEWTAFQNVPPFNLVFEIASSVNDQLTTSTQQDLSIGLPIGITTANVSILSSSTLTQLFVTAGNGHNIPACDLTCAQAKTATLMGYLSTMIYAGTGITTIAMIL